MFNKYSKFEDLLINKFNSHLLWRALPGKTNDFFINILLQLGYLSSNFVMLYEQAKLGLDMDEAKELIRVILRDEIPVNLPTHQDDRLYDLIEKIGISKKIALCTPASPTTLATISDFFDLIAYSQPNYDLRVLITLRIVGEVLVAETYRHIVPALTKRFGIHPYDSKFYYPHFVHDQKSGNGHTDSFDKILKSLIVNKKTLEIAIKSAEKAFKTRLAFYDQFI